MPGVVRSVYLVRHAIAYERGPRWPDDSKRPLTREGIEKMRAAMVGLRALNPGIDVVVTSPFTRAAATADLLLRGLPNRAKLVTSSALEPDKAPADLAQDLAAIKAESLALVGHEPGMGQLAAWLLGARHSLPFKKGGMCRIDLDSWPPAAGRGRLIWFATPRMLRALAGE